MYFCCLEFSSFFSSDTGVYFSAERVEAHLPADEYALADGILKLTWTNSISNMKSTIENVSLSS